MFLRAPIELPENTRSLIPPFGDSLLHRGVNIFTAKRYRAGTQFMQFCTPHPTLILKDLSLSLGRKERDDLVCPSLIMRVG